jgi:predicted phosphodiesterase
MHKSSSTTKLQGHLMQLQILSDLHVDAGGLHRPQLVAGVDAFIAAGDVCAGVEAGFQVLRQYVPATTPIIIVLGNHEFYGSGYTKELARARAWAPPLNIHLLENEAVTIGSVRFVGATLWTDYDLFGADNRDDCMRTAAMGLNDHRLIGLTTGGSSDQRFKPHDALALHQQSRAYLAETLAIPHAGPTVVVTHHAPHANSVAAHYRNSLLSAAFVSDLSDLIEAHQPNLWVHGHTHTSFDYCVSATRILCNPAGYGRENPAFDPALVVEV